MCLCVCVCVCLSAQGSKEASSKVFLDFSYRICKIMLRSRVMATWNAIV